MITFCYVKRVAVFPSQYVILNSEMEEYANSQLICACLHRQKNEKKFRYKECGTWLCSRVVNIDLGRIKGNFYMVVLWPSRLLQATPKPTTY